MKWIIERKEKKIKVKKKKIKPEPGDVKIKIKFAFFPIILDKTEKYIEIIWFEKYIEIYRYRTIYSEFDPNDKNSFRFLGYDWDLDKREIYTIARAKQFNKF